MKKILIINAHSASRSLSNAIVEAYGKQVEEQGHETHYLALGSLKFDPILREGYGKIQELEPDLLDAQKWILWADHIVWVFPMWWSTVPALLKGFIDRTFLPGFAFKYHTKDPFWDKLLAGRSTDVIYTMGTPVFIQRFFMGNPVIKVLNGILGFSGLKPMRVLRFGSIRTLTQDQVQAIIDKTKAFAKSYRG